MFSLFKNTFKKYRERDLSFLEGKDVDLVLRDSLVEEQIEKIKESREIKELIKEKSLDRLFIDPLYKVTYEERIKLFKKELQRKYLGSYTINSKFLKSKTNYDSLGELVVIEYTAKQLGISTSELFDIYRIYYKTMYNEMRANSVLIKIDMGGFLTIKLSLAKFVTRFKNVLILKRWLIKRYGDYNGYLDISYYNQLKLIYKNSFRKANVMGKILTRYRLSKIIRKKNYEAYLEKKEKEFELVNEIITDELHLTSSELIENSLTIHKEKVKQKRLKKEFIKY